MKTYSYYAEPVENSFWYIIWDIEGTGLSLLVPFKIN